MAFLDETGLAELWSLVKAEDAKLWDAISVVPEEDGGSDFAGHNFVLNWNFANPANANGKTSYQTAGYTIDLWNLRYADKYKIDLVDGAIKFTMLATGTNWNYFANRIPSYENLLGKTVTVSLLARNVSADDRFCFGIYGADSITTGSTTFPASTQRYVKNGLNTYTVTLPETLSNTGINFIIFPWSTAAVGDSIEVLGVKVEIGSQSTLAVQDSGGNLVIDTAPVVSGSKLARVVAGGYVGSGTYGEDNPCSLTFDFTPKVLIIMTNAESATFPSAIFVRGMSNTQGTWHDTDFKLEMHLSWSGNTVSWYSTRNTMNDYAQMNRVNQEYMWVAIGS